MAHRGRTRELIAQGVHNDLVAFSAELVGYSASTISRIETGKRKLTDITQLRRFADALGIPADLFGLTLPPGNSSYGAASPPVALAPTTVRETTREDGDDAVRRRELLAGLVGVTGTGLLSVTARPAPEPVEVQVLHHRLTAARATFHACHYHDLAVMLPDVIATAQASFHESTDHQHEQLAALLADSYSLASNLRTRLHDDALAWVTAERARSAAETSGNVASIAEAARMTSIAMRRHEHHETATELLTTTALSLGADCGDPAPELLATYGSLLCTASYTAAQHGNRTSALELIAEAETAATRLGDARVLHNPFSPTNVTIYQIGVHTALGDAGTALDHAGKIDLRSVPTPERQARFCLDTARAWHRFGNPSKCFQALLVAERCAPEELRRTSVRALVAALLNVPGPTPSGLREFAVRCGAAV